MSSSSPSILMQRSPPSSAAGAARGSRSHSATLGLKKRMEFAGRRISSQHRQLDDFYAVVRRALDAGAIHSAREFFYRFQDAVDAHLSLEEELYFPALFALRPALRSQLERIRAEHDGIREQMRLVRKLLESNEQELSSEHMSDLANSLADHEEREEELVGRITSHNGKPD